MQSMVAPQSLSEGTWHLRVPLFVSLQAQGWGKKEIFPQLWKWFMFSIWGIQCWYCDMPPEVNEFMLYCWRVLVRQTIESMAIPMGAASQLPALDLTLMWDVTYTSLAAFMPLFSMKPWFSTQLKTNGSFWSNMLDTLFITPTRRSFQRLLFILSFYGGMW